MNVEDYVRFYNRSWTEIGQIVDEVEDSHLKVVKCKDGYYDLDNFIKSSPNIIDLIEVGDYVDKLRVVDKYEDYIVIETFDERIFIYKNEPIKSIVTKEQFESMEYKVGE